MLDEFIVLGLIPGTQLQITFNFWLTILSCLGTSLWLWHGYKTQALQRLVITSGIFALTHRRLSTLHL